MKYFNFIGVGLRFKSTDHEMSTRDRNVVSRRRPGNGSTLGRAEKCTFDYPASRNSNFSLIYKIEGTIVPRTTLVPVQLCAHAVIGWGDDRYGKSRRRRVVAPQKRCLYGYLLSRRLRKEVAMPFEVIPNAIDFILANIFRQRSHAYHVLKLDRVTPKHGIRCGD